MFDTTSVDFYLSTKRRIINQIFEIANIKEPFPYESEEDFYKILARDYGIEVLCTPLGGGFIHAKQRFSVKENTIIGEFSVDSYGVIEIL